MVKRKSKIGDKVVVLAASPITFAAGVRDELGTRKLRKSMVGRVYTVRGFDKYGFVELSPKSSDTVWIEPELLKLRRRRKTPKV